ncbi:hypothetical protein EU528_06425 [Candidatus Thorarchaeota archaeon]|nr:MAG: hypothetical protein EU528_06425 [Candidatus Thorarchaeota archaeon]
MSRRKSLILLGIISVLFLASKGMVAEAHTPGPIVLEYNIGTGVLTVTVTHSTSDVNSHYIYEIVVEKNSVQVDIKTYTNQSSSSQVVETFSVAAVAGDVLRASAKCSVSGQISGEITVPSTTTTTTTSTSATTSTTPDYTIIAILTATAIIAIGIVLVLLVIIGRR